MRYFSCDPLADVPMFDTPSWKVLLEVPEEAPANLEVSVRANALEAIHSKCGEEFFAGLSDELRHHFSRLFPIKEMPSPNPLRPEDGVINGWRFWFEE